MELFKTVNKDAQEVLVTERETEVFHKIHSLRRDYQQTSSQVSVSSELPPVERGECQSLWSTKKITGKDVLID